MLLWFKYHIYVRSNALRKKIYIFIFIDFFLISSIKIFTISGVVALECFSCQSAVKADSCSSRQMCLQGDVSRLVQLLHLLPVRLGEVWCSAGFLTGFTPPIPLRWEFKALNLSLFYVIIVFVNALCGNTECIISFCIGTMSLALNQGLSGDDVCFFPDYISGVSNPSYCYVIMTCSYISKKKSSKMYTL